MTNTCVYSKIHHVRHRQVHTGVYSKTHHVRYRQVHTGQDMRPHILAVCLLNSQGMSKKTQ